MGIEYEADDTPEGDYVIPRSGYMGAEPTLSGHHDDDDGMLIPDLLLEVAPTEPYPLPVRRDDDVPTRENGPPPTTRVLAGRLTLGVGEGPVLALPADPNRVHLQLFVLSALGVLASEPVLWSSEANLTYSDMSANSIFPLSPFISPAPGCHTGAVWVRASTANTVLSTFHYVAVTK